MPQKTVRLDPWMEHGHNLQGEAYGYPGKPEGKPIQTSWLVFYYLRDDGQLMAHCLTRDYELGELYPGRKMPKAAQEILNERS